MSESLPVNTNISHYRSFLQLCAGAMGEVWLAEDTRLDRKVALELLPAAFTQDAERVRRFVQEAKAASAPRSKGPGSASRKQKSGASKASCCCRPPPAMRSRKRKAAITRPSKSPGSKTRNRGNCAPQRASRACGNGRAGLPQRGRCWQRLTAGLPKASARRI